MKPQTLDVLKVLAVAGGATVAVSVLLYEVYGRKPPVTVPPVNPPSHQACTWIGTHVTPELAAWCKSLNFADVSVRYDDDMVGSMTNLQNLGIQYRNIVAFGTFQGISDTSVNGYENKIQQQIALSPNGKITVDDIHMGWPNDQARYNFLQALRNLNLGEDVILVYYADAAYALQDDWTGLHITLYGVPSESATLDVATLQTKNPASLGWTLWAWGNGGSGDGVYTSWEIMTQSLINGAYDVVTNNNFKRILIWTGYEDQSHEVGMLYASLYNYPNWWPTITSQNQTFENLT